MSSARETALRALHGTDELLDSTAAARSQGCSLFCNSCHRLPFACLSCFILAFFCCLSIFCFCILLLSFFPPLSPMVAPFRMRSTISPWKRSSPSRITRPDLVVHLVPPCVTGAESNTCGPMRLAARSPLRRSSALVSQNAHTRLGTGVRGLCNTGNETPLSGLLACWRARIILP